ncbi:hypothetical protein DL89DRAFT_268291 [Linderina pennispora]|uniref:Queuosine 5'-phosphate N-glycosylase/hydrolase n=1 Tax=Linderina pennispora TaxID=61395 RepID=A0A1Y1W7H9_9FUNG|nr:uncharacterized protein DL89DRAFT_268291 [Linderina pennispora]ORX69288.1 hypothetical protein DL89DRAFT_268291 [Linderina pennispora]
MPVAEIRLAADRVLDSAEFINRTSQDVSVPLNGVKAAAQKIMQRMQQIGYSTAEWKKNTLTPSVADSAAIEWIFVVDSLNFSFWTDKPQANQYTVSLDGQAYRGYWTLCAAVNRAMREGIPITDAAYCAGITREQVSYIFRTDDTETQEPIPMLDERVSVLNEVGRVLLEKYQGKFSNVLRQAQGSAQRLVEMVVRDFTCFRDEHMYMDRIVCIYKRAQILVADLWACFEGKGQCQFADIDNITMFADYRVPQALYHFGALSYSERLFNYLECKQNGELLESGHPWEVEIRGNSIWAVELIRRQITALGMHVNAILLDFYIWDYAKEFADEMKGIPIHLTRSVFY